MHASKESFEERYCPAPQFLHGVPALPAEHFVQLALRGSFAINPKGHALHIDLPVASWYSLTSHTVQVVWPSFGVKVPGKQEMHEDWALSHCAFPAAHLMHARVEFESRINWPISHASQSCCPSSTAVLPGMQGRHDAWSFFV
jgi:hypothetical protein